LGREGHEEGNKDGRDNFHAGSETKRWGVVKEFRNVRNRAERKTATPVLGWKMNGKAVLVKKWV
jgi:hypothetical protein